MATGVSAPVTRVRDPVIDEQDPPTTLPMAASRQEVFARAGILRGQPITVLLDQQLSSGVVTPYKGRGVPVGRRHSECADVRVVHRTSSRLPKPDAVIGPGDAAPYCRSAGLAAGGRTSG